MYRTTLTQRGLSNTHNLIPGTAASFAVDPKTIKYLTLFSGLNMPTFAPDFRSRSSNKRETNIAVMRFAQSLSKETNFSSIRSVLFRRSDGRSDDFRAC